MKYKGYIRYFDNISGLGVFRIPELNNKCFTAHFSADERYKKFPLKQEYSYKEDTPIECIIFEDSHFVQVSRFKVSNYCSIDDIKSDRLLELLEQGTSKNIDFFIWNACDTSLRQEFKKGA